MSPSIVEEYRRRVARGDFASDDAQMTVAVRLDRLASELAGQRPQRPQPRWRKFLPGNGEPQPAPRGLYIWGGVGRGKTMLMDLFHEHAPVTNKRRVHFHSFMQEVHGRMHDIRQRQRRGEIWEDANPVAMIAEAVGTQAHLLCFDEFQVSDIADAMILGRLFEALLANGVVVVATSNTPPSQLYRDGLNRQVFLPFISLIEERLEVLELASPQDYRTQQITAENLYVTPLGAAADGEVDRLWRELTHGAKEESRALMVNGRRVDAPRTARGAARFTFAELCGRPLGPADYIAVAQAFHTVIIEHVPRLPEARRDEARRLTTLIDTLYDRRVRVIVSAETQPEAIYSGTRQAAEFARTASRLREMRSAVYWERFGTATGDA
jgi:cell division protein ZapE